MKLRESGMPPEAQWEGLFDVPLILDRLGVDHQIGDAVELGCGYGTFSLPIARRISGMLLSFDIEPEMVARTRERAQAGGVSNIICEARDVFELGFGVPEGSQDACLLFNILHGERPVHLLKEAAGVVAPGGSVLVIHWRHDAKTPRGPRMDIRPSPERILEWASLAGCLETGSPVLDLPPWHYGIRLMRLGGI